MITVDPQYARAADGSMVELAREPFLWFDNKDDTVCYQNGKYYRGVGQGQELLEKDVPRWFWEDLQKSYSTEKIEKWGIKIPALAPEKKEEPKVEEMWECDECDAVVPFKNKGFHVATHRRKHKAHARKKAYENQKKVENGEPAI